MMSSCWCYQQFDANVSNHLCPCEQCAVSGAVVKANGNTSGRRSAFLPLASQSTSLRSVRAISGRTSGFAPQLVSQSKGSLTRVRCEATVAEKEAPVEKYEYQAEVVICSLFPPKNDSDLSVKILIWRMISKALFVCNRSCYQVSILLIPYFNVGFFVCLS